MKKSPIMKFFIMFVLIFFILSTGLMFVLYLASPSTIIDTTNTQEEVTAEVQEDTVVIPSPEEIVDVSASGTLQE